VAVNSQNLETPLCLCGQPTRWTATVPERSPAARRLPALGGSGARIRRRGLRGELIQAYDDREAVQVSPDELFVIDIHSL